jgi:hypothetical protein
MQAGVHEIAANVYIVQLLTSALVVFLCLFDGLNTLCGVFIVHLSRKARGCCLHVFLVYFTFSINLSTRYFIVI